MLAFDSQYKIMYFMDKVINKGKIPQRIRKPKNIKNLKGFYDYQRFEGYSTEDFEYLVGYIYLKHADSVFECAKFLNELNTSQCLKIIDAKEYDIFPPHHLMETDAKTAAKIFNDSPNDLQKALNDILFVYKKMEASILLQYCIIRHFKKKYGKMGRIVEREYKVLERFIEYFNPALEDFYNTFKNLFESQLKEMV